MTPTPSKAQSFTFLAPSEVPVDQIITAPYAIVGEKVSLISSTMKPAAKHRRGPAGKISPRIICVLTFRRSPYVLDDALQLVIGVYGTILSISHPTYKDRPHLFIGTRVLRMEMAKAVLNFVYFTGHREMCDAPRPQDRLDAPADPGATTCSNDDTSESESTGSLVIDEAEWPASPESMATSEETPSICNPSVAVSTDYATESMDTSTSGGDSDGTSAFDRGDVVKMTLPSATDPDACGRGSARLLDPKKLRRAWDRPIVQRLPP
ncbi:hypothetical protein HPB47_020537 [Ixodes persulcatus]|uniref:Uncharacterized protein n=1 Tax=Ixodes persulcatus TaxID=34615 RepID=A0AC60QF47_IXOPE|nr:hypothetical protein HPB47_020537 [Ixodes persulcatus]